MAIDPVTGLFVASALPAIVESVGGVVGGIAEFFGKEPREVKIAEALGEKELALDIKRQDLENRRLYGYDDPSGKHHKGSIELQEEASMRGLENKLEKFGTIYQKLKQQHGDTAARSLLGAISFDPRLSSPISAPPPVQSDLQKFYTPIEYRGMARGVEGIQSNLLTYLQQAQMQKQAEKAEKKISKAGVKTERKIEGAVAKSEELGETVREFEKEAEKKIQGYREKIEELSTSKRKSKALAREAEQEREQALKQLKKKQEERDKLYKEMIEAEREAKKKIRGIKGGTEAKLAIEKILSNVEREVGTRKFQREQKEHEQKIHQAELLRQAETTLYGKLFTGRGKKTTELAEQSNKLLRKKFDPFFIEQGLNPEKIDRKEYMRKLAQYKPKAVEKMLQYAGSGPSEIDEYLRGSKKEKK